MTPDQQSPLTLEFHPEAIEGDEVSEPIAIIEPSFQHDGRIFVGLHPFGKRVGLHLLPADAERVRNHLSKLLMDRPEPEELPSEGGIDWEARLRESAQRVLVEERKAAKKREPLLGHFRLEWQIGRFVFVMGTEQRD